MRNQNMDAEGREIQKFLFSFFLLLAPVIPKFPSEA